IGAFAIDGSHMYAGTGEVANAIDALYGQGVYSSADSGATWTLNNPSGVFTNLAVSALVVDSGGNVYAATAQHYAAGSGIYKSTDHGATWNPLAAASLLAGHDVTDLAIGSDDTLYAAVGDPGGSANLEYNNPVTQAWYDLMIAADPNTTTVYVGTYDLYKTSTGSATDPTWADITNVYSGPPKVIHPDQHTLLISGGKLWVGNDGGVFVSSDGGTTWSSSDGNLNMAQFYGGSVGSNPSQVLGGLQDNGTIYTATAGPTWTDET